MNCKHITEYLSKKMIWMQPIYANANYPYLASVLVAERDIHLMKINYCPMCGQKIKKEKV